MHRDFYHFAFGHNNVDNLRQLHLISPPLFSKYSYWIQGEWRDQEELALSASRRRVPIGLSWIALTFEYLTQPELDLLVSEFVTNGIDGLVTVRAWNQSNDTWNNYNAIMFLNFEESTQAGGEWYDFRVELRELEVLT